MRDSRLEFIKIFKNVVEKNLGKVEQLLGGALVTHHSGAKTSVERSIGAWCSSSEFSHLFEHSFYGLETLISQK